MNTETPEEAEERRRIARIKYAIKMETETPEERAIRLEKKRKYNRERWHSLPIEKRRERYLKRRAARQAQGGPS